MHEHVTDHYVKLARAQGYRSRAAYKLLELDERDRLLKPGMSVVDLGASPGGWAQVAAQKVAPGGKVIALDILPMPALPGVVFIHGDFSQKDVREKVEKSLAGKRVDLVLSDMAPNISGVRSVDQARSIVLAELALEFAAAQLQPQGVFLVKLFQGAEFDEFVRHLRARFAKVTTRKPKASRERSNEVYALGREPIKLPHKGIK